MKFTQKQIRFLEETINSLIVWDRIIQDAAGVLGKHETYRVATNAYNKDVVSLEQHGIFAVSKYGYTGD